MPTESVLLYGMRSRMRDMKAGDVVKVTNGFDYPLPPGLQDGDTVKLVAFDHGYWTVEKDGRKFLVYLSRLDPGFEYELGGRWLRASDWRAKAMREATCAIPNPICAWTVRLLCPAALAC